MDRWWTSLSLPLTCFFYRHLLVNVAEATSRCTGCAQPDANHQRISCNLLASAKHRQFQRWSGNYCMEICLTMYVKGLREQRPLPDVTGYERHRSEAAEVCWSPTMIRWNFLRTMSYKRFMFLYTYKENSIYFNK